MDADSPFANTTDQPNATEAPDLDAAVARQDAEDAGPEMTDEQLEQVDNLHDAQAADFGPLHELLWQAGAHIDPLLLAEWTPEQVDEASEWARAQITATAADEPGKRTAVKWPDHVSAAHHESAAGGVDASIPGAEAPLDQTLTECRCEKCGTKAKWTGPLTPAMLGQTFTRGVDEASGLPNCVHCGTAMVPVQFLKTEDAITQAAERLDTERAGEPVADAEPASQAKPRHAKPADRQKVKNDAKKSTAKKQPAKATLKSGAKKKGTQKS